jgi:ABC-type spermidine/putrescine transport system permease subunit II
MIETTRQVGHTLGATISASALALALPAAIGLLSPSEAQTHYVQGLQMTALVVSGVIVVGALLTLYQKSPLSPEPVLRTGTSGSDGGS